jgi:pantoate kinase
MISMKAAAFAPGHISGFFEPVYMSSDVYRTGSRGSGITISLGAITEIQATPSINQNIDILVNKKHVSAPVSRQAIRHLIGDTPLKVTVNTDVALPQGHGFGMSAACALSATYALAKIVELPREDALKAAHCAEVELFTGLGDIVASSFGGIEIRREPGLPPWGMIEHIPGKYELVLCIIGKKLQTQKILRDTNKRTEIAQYGRYCTQKILENPSVETLFTLSQLFAKKTGLINKQVHEAIKAANQHGMASMCMLGNSVFSIGDTEKLCKTLASFGKVYVCTVDPQGARIL